MGEGSYITLFSPSDVTEFHRIGPHCECLLVEITSDIGSMLGQRRRRYPNIEPTLGLWIAFAGIPLLIDTRAWFLQPTEV